MANFSGYSPYFSNNRFYFTANVSRSGDTVSISSVTVSSRWIVDSLAAGWTFAVWVNGTAITSQTLRNWSIGSYSSEYAETYTLSLNCSATVSASSAATVKVGVAGMTYNGSYYSDVTYSQTFASIAIIPAVPSISVSFGDSTSFAYKGVNVYKLQNPTIKVTSNGNATHTRFGLQYKSAASFTGTGDNSGWSDVTLGSSGSFVSGNINQVVTLGSEWRGRVVRLHADAKSSTGNTSAWSSWVFFIINDLPTMNGDTVKVNSSIVTDNVTITWGSSSDSINSSKGYRINVYNTNTGGNYTTDVGDTVSASLNLSSAGIGRGQKALIQIQPKDNLEMNGTKYGSAYVTRNSLPYFSSGAKITTDVDSATYNKYFLNNVTITIPAASDSEGQSIQYRAYYRKRSNGGSAWGNWTGIGSLDANRVKTLTPTMSKGEQVQFGAIAYDGLEYSQSVSGNGDLTIMSQVLTKASNPSAPSSITITPSLDAGTTHYESINSISWSSVTASNGSTVSNYRVGVEVKQSLSTSSLTHDTSKNVGTTSTTWDITTTSFVRGYYFRFKVVAIDMFGLESDIKYTEWFRRNKAPGAVTYGTFKVNSNKDNFYQTVPLKWDAAIDPDNDKVTYRIYFSQNRGGFNEIASNISATSYIHNIANLSAGTTLGYKIVAYDKFGIASSETLIEKCHSLVVNTPPSPVQIIYPSSKVYDAQPRILFKTKGDKNNDSVTVVVTHNGEVFNSATSTSMFNKTSFDPLDDNGVFIPKKLKEGINTIKVKVFDGYEYSQEISLDITYQLPLLNTIGDNNDVLISKVVYDKFTTMINDSRLAYGLGAIAFNSVTANNTFITSTDFNKLYTSISDVNNFINNEYPGLTRSKTKPIISKNNLISKQVHNSILDIITNL